MSNILYAQLDADNICRAVTEEITDIEARPENVGQKRVWIEEHADDEGNVISAQWEWQEVPKAQEPYQPTNVEVAQMVSDLQADLIIAGVI